MDYSSLLRQAIDLHVHVGPEVIPRKFTVPELIAYETGKLAGIGVKNHFFPTAAMAPRSSDGSFIINSVVLNHYVGGFNPDVIRASAALSERPIVVWFPTLHAKSFLESHEYEIPGEWIDPALRRKIRIRESKDIAGLSVRDARGELKKEVRDVLSAIKECDAILATGHLSWQESRLLVRVAARDIGIKRMIVTHPIYQKITMPIEIQQELASMGALMEHSYSMYAIDKIPIDDIVLQIREVGVRHCILSSDVGQTFSKSPSESLADFISLLEQKGITEDEIRTMLVRNPTRLIQ